MSSANAVKHKQADLSEKKVNPGRNIFSVLFPTC